MICLRGVRRHRRTPAADATYHENQVYDPKTLRYDQPYATGNCAGEGICGTCFVEVRRLS